MNDMLDPSKMAEATRLTRAGRLTQATALLRRMFGAKPAPDVTFSPLGNIVMGSGLGHLGLAQPAPVRTPDIVTGRGQFIAATYSNAAGTRDYKLYIPGG